MGSPLAARHSDDSQFCIIGRHEYTFFVRELPTEYNNRTGLLVYCDNRGNMQTFSVTILCHLLSSWRKVSASQWTADAVRTSRDYEVVWSQRNGEEKDRVVRIDNLLCIYRYYVIVIYRYYIIVISKLKQLAEFPILSFFLSFFLRSRNPAAS